MIFPTPRRIVPAPGRFTFDHATAVHAPGPAAAAADLLRILLRPATGLPLPSSPDGAVLLAVDPALTAELGPEGYRLSVAPEAVRLHAAATAGLLHGIQRLRQLLPAEALLDRPVPDVRWELPCLTVTDRPRYPWRGLMLDVARHFLPVSYLHRTVDLLALHGLNVLHLHLTDDQGWRMPVYAYPRLTAVGSVRARTMTGRAGSDSFDDRPHGGAYTKAELRGLVRHAAERGVTVVPEIEMPGHARAALAAHPRLGNHPERRLDVWTEWGVCENVLGVHEEALAFCTDVLDEVMDVFPSPYVHLGGDECPTAEWEAAPSARRRAAELGLASPKELHGWFLGRVGAHLLEHGRRPVCWAEDSSSPGLPPEFTVMPWRDADHGLDAARRGHDIVMAPYRATYLDYPTSDRPGEPLGQDGAVVDLRAVHGLDPAPAHWPEEARARVLGAQAQLWTEFVPDPAEADRRLYPRLCALAERAWNPDTDWPAFERALTGHRPRLAALGLPADL
ncbi:beta-N-acetylhexosaminidase [Kitasatospora arboriphila]|uniref:beta-N-acetylhexosaminidase n=1 Tax=Kitasatospora arboriphila TaxID=258052 RepID=A0ABN1U4X8_9ACTN